MGRDPNDRYKEERTSKGVQRLHGEAPEGAGRALAWNELEGPPRDLEGLPTELLGSQREPGGPEIQL